MHNLRIYTLIMLLLAFTVISLGAYTRLKDAGLGCPDWPGCYGQWTIPTGEDAVKNSSPHYSSHALDTIKASAEMVHRYAASTLGLLILINAIMVFKSSSELLHRQRPLSLLLVAVVIAQGMLGKFTVTLQLNPIIVVTHLAGGLTTLSLIFVLLLQRWFPAQAETNRAFSKINTAGIICLAILVFQILLGGWVSSNYAARICPEFPICTDQWWQEFNLQQTFQLPLTATGNFEYAPHLDASAKISIHMLHRIGALLTAIALASYYFMQWRMAGRFKFIRLLACAGLIILSTQILLGISNVLFDLPLPVATLHNAFAALNLLTLLSVNFAHAQKEINRGKHFVRNVTDINTPARTLA